MLATLVRHARDLQASRSDVNRCCFTCDSGQVGATVLDRAGRWLIVHHFDGNAVAAADQVALVTLDEPSDSAALGKLALGTNFEDDPLWLVDVRSLAKLNCYGKALTVLWRSDKP